MPKLVALLDVADGKPDSVTRALDELARAYTDVIPTLQFRLDEATRIALSASVAHSLHPAPQHQATRS